MKDRLILNTDHPVRHPWPEEVYVQGGDHGVVFSCSGEEPPYGTAFVEAFPGDTFLRGEGVTIVEAEDKAWEQYQRYRNCDGSLKFGEWHGPYERRSYTNGAGFCTRCGIWMSGVFEPLPEEPRPARSLLEKAISGDDKAVWQVLGTVAEAKQDKAAEE